MRAIVPLALAGAVLGAASSVAAPPLTVGNVNVARPDIRIWNVKATSPVRQGSSTSKESGSVSVEHRDGTTTKHDATLKVESTTLFQDGEICHNYGPKCYCGTTTFRLESGAPKWKFAVPSGNRDVPCPSGIRPTGDSEIKRSMTKEELEAKKQQILKERAAKKGG